MTHYKNNTWRSEAGAYSFELVPDQPDKCNTVESLKGIIKVTL